MDHLLTARQARFGNNQSLFRSVNEEMETLSAAGTTVGAVGFFCECANPDCSDRIDLSLGDYEAIRQSPTQFFVLPKHVFLEVEAVVDDRSSYVIVDKFGEGGRVAVATDDRQPTP
jgi:hypothetical protein